MAQGCHYGNHVTMKKAIGPILSCVLITGVAIAVFSSIKKQQENDEQAAGDSHPTNLIKVEGLTGSEKKAYFRDERVVRRFAELGYEVIAHKAGSRQIATKTDPKLHQFGFPSGLPAGAKMTSQIPKAKAFYPFFTPMTIASWKPIAEILEANQLASKRNGHYFLDVAAYLKLVEAGTRWKELKASEAYPASKQLLVSSTDVRKSNSAAMYLALSSYVSNQKRVVSNAQDAERVLPLMTRIFKDQGFTEYSSAAPFQNYLVMGMGKAPLTFIYESQFIERIIAADGSILPEMVLIYPDPGIFSKHVFVAWTKPGIAVGELLETDPELQRLAAEYGFRTRDVTFFRELTKKHKLPIPSSLVNVIDPPSYELTETMIQAIEATY
jgi:hypothetical protein